MQIDPKHHEFMGTYHMPNGLWLYVYKNHQTGGRIYLSDEIGGGVFVWETALVSPQTLGYALRCEAELSKKDAQEDAIKQGGWYEDGY